MVTADVQTPLHTVKKIIHPTSVHERMLTGQRNVMEKCNMVGSYCVEAEEEVTM
jgi:hypothetical protein